MILDHTIKLRDGVKEITFNVVAKVEDGDYSWSAEAVLKRRPDGAMFNVEDGGCSCNSLGEAITVADLKPIQTMWDAYRLTSAERTCSAPSRPTPR